MESEKSGQTPVIVQSEKTFGLIPRNLQEALTLAKYMSESELVPKQYQRRPGDCLIAMQLGAEIGLQPMASLQSIAVINGKPCVYGDAGKALLLQAGCLIEEDDVEAIRQSGVARCRITRPNGAVIERTFSRKDAETAKLWGKPGPWTEYPYRQMAWRAFWFAARDGCADILKGFYGAEELRDYPAEKEINPPPPRASGAEEKIREALHKVIEEEQEQDAEGEGDSQRDTMEKIAIEIEKASTREEMQALRRRLEELPLTSPEVKGLWLSWQARLRVLRQSADGDETKSAHAED